MSKKLKVGVLGATGMVGQRFLSLLENHPWYEVTLLAASQSSAGKRYADAVAGRWAMKKPIPAAVSGMTVGDASDVKRISDEVDFVFCAVDMSKDETAKLEEAYARAETPVVSNNSAHRWTPDVPMMVPEVNPEHVAIIEAQRRRLGTKSGFIAVKPNCSIQSYVPALHPLMKFGPKKIAVADGSTPVSGAPSSWRIVRASRAIPGPRPLDRPSSSVDRSEKGRPGSWRCASTRHRGHLCHSPPEWAGCGVRLGVKGESLPRGLRIISCP